MGEVEGIEKRERVLLTKKKKKRLTGHPHNVRRAKLEKSTKR